MASNDPDLPDPSADPQPGDLIEIFRPAYQHWALYLGDGYIINLTPVGERELILTDSDYLGISGDRLLWHSLNKINRMHAITFEFSKGSILVGMTLVFKQTGGQMWTVGPVCYVYVSCTHAEILIGLLLSVNIVPLHGCSSFLQMKALQPLCPA